MYRMDIPDRNADYDGGNPVKGGMQDGAIIAAALPDRGLNRTCP